MDMPKPNYFFENLKPTHHVELRTAGTNEYYVAVIDGVEGVVNMDGRHQRKQQKALDQMVNDSKMRAKGYKFRLDFVPAASNPLYAKTQAAADDLIADYKGQPLAVTPIAD